MNKAEALHIAMTAIMREILREGESEVVLTPGGARPLGMEPTGPQPRFDFDESADVCYHNGFAVPRAECPEHSDEAQRPVTAEELDDITSETFEEENPMIARARRLAERKARQESQHRQYAEELPMAGAGPPPDIPPNLVV